MWCLDVKVRLTIIALFNHLAHLKYLFSRIWCGYLLCDLLSLTNDYLWRRRSSCLLGASAGGERGGQHQGRAPGASAGSERWGEVRWAAAQSARAGGGGAPSVVARGARKGINRAMGSGAG